MKWKGTWFITIGLIIGLTGLISAAEKAEKHECISKTKEAVQMIKLNGLEATLEKINDKKGPFVWKDSYVFSIEENTAKLLAHPYVPPAMMGKSFKEIKDKKGKAYFKEILEVANKRGEGWVDYVYPDPQGIPSKKIAYVLKVPGEKVILVAGIYAESSKIETVATLQDKKAALILCPNGFDDSEYKSLKDSFDRLGIETKVFASKTGVIRGMHGTQVQTDGNISELSTSKFDAVVFVGGRGLEEYLANPTIHKIARGMVDENKVVAANYWAPVILANAGVLTGRKATVTPIEADALTNNGAHYTAKILTVDGRIITGNGSAAVDLYADLVVAKMLIDSFQ